MATATDPCTPSSDHMAMLPYWDMVETIIEGADAMRGAGQAYLPRFPNETEADYGYRRCNAKFTNIYSDILSNLASKPFAEETTLVDGAGSRFEAMAEDIDGRGNNLHVFASTTFYDGIKNAIDWILVDYTKARPNPDGSPLSIAQERDQGLRPYWVHIPAKRMLAVYSDVVNGREEIVHARMREDFTRRSGFDETFVERVRVFDRAPIFDVVDGVQTEKVIGYAPAMFEVWEKRATNRSTQSAWQVADGGPVTIGVIPLVPFITGKRKGGSWRFIPPLKDAAFLQIEHYQQETALKSIKELTAFPMLAGNGVSPATDAAGNPAPVPVGPRTVLYAPPNGDTGQGGEWAFIEPSAESLTFLAAEVENTETQMREIGRQPLVAAQMTVVQAGMNAQKANSAIQAWALGLKDALEQAFVLTAKWLNEAVAPEVRVFTDFDVGLDDDKGPDTLVAARKNGDLSQETFWEELKRRSILSADFDASAERDRLDAELPDPVSEAELEAAAMVPPAKVAA